VSPSSIIPRRSGGESAHSVSPLGLVAAQYRHCLGKVDSSIYTDADGQ
jgi:hypothetical protein